MTLQELKTIDSIAYVRLIEFWSDISHIEFIKAKYDLVLDMDIRYYLFEKEDTFVLEDSHSGDSFTYRKDLEEWIFL